MQSSARVVSLLTLWCGCAANEPGTSVDDTVDAADVQQATDAAIDTRVGDHDVAPPIPEDAEEVCTAFCTRLHGCLGEICPFEVIGDEAYYVERCVADCVDRPLEIAVAREIGFARCDILTERECRYIPDLDDFCDCGRTPPVTGDLSVCGYEGFVDVTWCTGAACERWYHFTPDGAFEHSERLLFQPESRCERGQWATLCAGPASGFNQLWLRSDHGIEVHLFALEEGQLFVGDVIFSVDVAPSPCVP